MQSRNVTEQAVVIMEVSVLVKPFCARIYGWVTEKALMHSPPLTSSNQRTAQTDRSGAMQASHGASPDFVFFTEISQLYR